MKHNGATNTSASLHGLFLLCLYETVIDILCLHLSLAVYMHKDILYYLYEGISTVVYLLLSLLTSLRNGSLRSSLLMFLSCVRVYMRNGILQSSLLLSLRNSFVHAFLITSICKIFLHRLYKDISTVTPKQVKPETTKLWLPLHSSLQPYMEYFYKLTTYCMIDYNHSINSGNIIQIVGYIMSMKRKERMKLKVYSPEENKYDLMFNNELSSDPDLL